MNRLRIPFSIQRLAQCCSQNFRISRFNKETIFHVHHFGYASYPASYHRPATEQRLQHDVGETFPDAGQAKNVTSTHPQRDLRMRVITHQTHTVG